MPHPSELLSVARLLCSAQDGRPPGDASLRRAVSTAYYAVFHTVLRSAAERFMGPDQHETAGFAILYRAFEHRQVKAVCEGLAASTLKERLRRHLRRPAVSQEMRDFADAFPELQDARHLADYDPIVQFRPKEAMSLINQAEVAIDAFNRTDLSERADVLALMLVGVRA